ncbi:MAG: hypothetical protein ACK4VP_09495, partial [Nitrospira sp.]
AAIPPIWPKLWRRLEEFLRQNASPKGFIDFLERRNERVDVLPLMEERGLHDLIEVQGHTVRLFERPEHLRVIGKAGHGAGAAARLFGGRVIYLVDFARCQG